jgi:hypothetical protein
MRAWETSVIKNPRPIGGYVSMNNPGETEERKLYIEDGEGNVAILKNEEIGELYKQIRPALEG